MNRKIILVVFVLLMIGTMPAMGKINIVTELGPFHGDHKYYVRLYNPDDSETLTINGKLIATVAIDQNILIDITSFLKDGDNIIILEDENTWYTWHYGFEIIQDSNTIWTDSCGRPGTGCENDDITLGTVYRNIITLKLESTMATMNVPDKKIPGFEIISSIFILIFIYTLFPRR